MQIIGFKLFAICFLYFLYRLLKPYLIPLPPKPNTNMVRKLTRDKLRCLGATRLCDKHSRQTVKVGQMVVVDNVRCDICNRRRTS